MLRLKQNYLLDSKCTKAELVGQRGCPEFPDSLWINVLLDQFIDLNKIYTGAYSLNPEYKHTEKVGDIEIVLNMGGSGSSPTKIIRTHDAVLFAYPHRARELDDYQCFIVGQFAALQDTMLHTRVINLDRAIRLRVARLNVYLLTSFDKFNDLVTQHILAPAAITISRGGTSDSAIPEHVGTDIAALPAAEDIESETVVRSRNSEVARNQSKDERWKHPKWSRGFIWSENAASLTPSATSTETAEPLPPVPFTE
ncbi:hypothetical protein K439DRAFT_1656514 [Ramaria rubella]|nr:hypothetical protein K439DRAFT_1656514 [Ramaria rubella]